jgi:Ca-activated chloride channel family protein
MKIASPLFLYILLGTIPAFFLFFWLVSQRKKKAQEKFGNLELIQKLSLSYSPKKKRWKLTLLFLALSFLLFALARPQIGTRLVEVKREGVDIVIALDVSLSMLAEDIKPNRLEKAKMEIASLMEKVQGDRIGLVAFAGASFIQCPLTLDLSAAKMFLDITDVGLIPQPGTAIGEAIRTSIKAFNEKERKHKVMILLTDGEDHQGEPAKAAEQAKEQGIVIFCIGIGTTQGEPIPLREKSGQVSGFKKTGEGEMVLSKLDEETLQKIALATGGRYYQVTSGEAELDKIYNDISKMEKKELEGKLMTQYEDRYQYFLLLSVLFLTLEFFISDRKGKRGLLRKKNDD